MSKENIDFRFVLNNVLTESGSKFEFVFLPGSDNPSVIEAFEENKKYLKGGFSSQYGSQYSNYISDFTLKNGFKTIAIRHEKLVNALQLIMGRNIRNPYKIKVTGFNDKRELEDVIINTYLDIEKAKKVIPYLNTNNNTLTTRRK